MYKIDDFDEYDWRAFHDCVCDSVGEPMSNEELSGVFKILPDDIRLVAFEWGMNDTDFLERVFRFLRDVS